VFHKSKTYTLNSPADVWIGIILTFASSS